MSTIRILLADGHAKVRTQIRARLIREPDLEIVGEASDSMQAVECALELAPQIVLMDPMMHDGWGLDAVRKICQRLPNTVIVVLTAFADTSLKVDLRRMGVHHVLDKGIESDRLVTILHEIAGAPRI